MDYDHRTGTCTGFGTYIDPDTALDKADLGVDNNMLTLRLPDIDTDADIGAFFPHAGLLFTNGGVKTLRLPHRMTTWWGVGVGVYLLNHDMASGGYIIHVLTSFLLV